MENSSVTRVLSVVGARPQFVKASLLSAEFVRRGIEEIVVHTGQHYDRLMSEVFFQDLQLPQPAHELNVGSGSHGLQTGEMLKRLEPVMQHEAPDWVLVYGDTNSTLAGALAASKLHLPIAHVEAGLRSFNRRTPEEINRVLTDHISDLLLAPTENAATQLHREGISSGVHIVGDLMVDLAVSFASRIPARPQILDRLQLEPGSYYACTIHRASNTDDTHAFARLLEGLRSLQMPVVFPVHPRTRAIAAESGAGINDNLILHDPLPYSEMLALVSRSAGLLTDSGGLQKEAFVLKVPCTTLRDETEWLETLEDGWNVLTGTDPKRIAAAAIRPVPSSQGAPFGDGNAARRIVDIILQRPSYCAV